METTNKTAEELAIRLLSIFESSKFEGGMLSCDRAVAAINDALLAAEQRGAQQAISKMETATHVTDYIRMRLAQIASGDYKACGVTAEEVAKDILLKLGAHDEA